MLGRIHPDFNSLRRFLKERVPGLKLRGYDDVDACELAELLSLDDFEEHEDLLVQMAFPRTTFRQEGFLAQVTDEAGHLRLVPEIRSFQVRVQHPAKGNPFGTLTYNAQREREAVHLIPHLKGRPALRKLACQVARLWSDGQNRYCLTLPLDDLCQRFEGGEAQVDFSHLSYSGMSRPSVSEADLQPAGLAQYRVGLPVTVDDTAETMREVLRAADVSQTGNKEELAAKLVRLSLRLYWELEDALDRFFGAQRFIRVGGWDGRQVQAFPLLQGCPLRENVLTLYLLRHLRGEAIVDVGFEDQGYGLEELAQAVVEKRVSLDDAFVRVDLRGDNAKPSTTEEGLGPDSN
jgi:hypothetical protein